MPAYLPRETVVHQAPGVQAGCRCPDCGGTLRKLGEDVAEVLEYVPSYFKVIRHVRKKHSCARCAGIVQAPAPSRLIERGLAGPGLLAHVLTGKYADHLPLYRQSEMYARAGVTIFEYIEMFYNRQRRHSHLGGVSPEAFEQASF